MLLFFKSLFEGIDNSYQKSIYFFLISFLSNTFSGISGGGAGLIQLPVLILSGIPYYQALATHKIATVALGIGSSVRNYKSLGNEADILLQILIYGIPGVVFGASIVEFISEEYLYLTLGIFSIFLALYSLKNENFGLLAEEKKTNWILKLRFIFLVFFIGILNGSISLLVQVINQCLTL